MLKNYLILTLCFLIGFTVGICQAQEEETEYSYGTVSKILSNQIVVTEYDYDEDTEVENIYIVDSNTVFRGVNSLKDIVIGDIVDIDFLVKNGRNIATNIIVEKSFPEDEYDEYEEEPEYVPEEVEY